MKSHTLFVFLYYTIRIAFVKYSCRNSMHGMNGTDFCRVYSKFSCEFFYHCESNSMISQRKVEHLLYIFFLFTNNLEPTILDYSCNPIAKVKQKQKHFHTLRLMPMQVSGWKVHHTQLVQTPTKYSSLCGAICF